VNRKWAPWWACAAVVIGALSFGLVNNSGPAQDNNARISAIARKLSCLVCDGESVEDSRAAFAQGLRDEVARQVQAGRTDSEILASIAATNTDEILLVPRAEGVNLLLWILPVVAVVVSLVGLAFAFRRWRRQTTDAHASDADEALVAQLREGALSSSGTARNE
jgi:cytochrome c-type biogenesis protein CcmH